MNKVLNEIVSLIQDAAGKPDFLDAVFGRHKEAALANTPVVIFGSGGLGMEMRSALALKGVVPVAFCDNDARKTGTTIGGLPVISFDELRRDHRHSMIVIAVLKHRAALAAQLLSAGFPPESLACTEDSADMAYMYSMVGTQVLLSSHAAQCHPESYLEFLLRNQDRVAAAHDLLHDEKSKSLLITKLALMASGGNYEIFCHFIREFSEPYREFGLTGYDGTPEDHYYFNNDIITLAEGEIYVDVGAYDGDTIESFTAACRNNNVAYARILAFEPDAACYEKLRTASARHPRTDCYPLGIWSESTTLRFESSANAIHDQAGAISGSGDTEIQVLSLDDFLEGDRVTLIKMDPGGNVIPQVLQGAATTIRKHRPKLAAGAYHGADSIFEIPILVHSLCPEYRIALRHNTFHLCDTDLLASC